MNRVCPALEALPGDMQVMARDVVAYRELLGPFYVTLDDVDESNHADCENRVGETVVVL